MNWRSIIKWTVLILAISGAVYLLWPPPVASEAPEPTERPVEALERDFCTLREVTCPERETEPQKAVYEPGSTRTVYAYNSVEQQTDSSPCVAASGADICKLHEEGTQVCASNAYPFGTRLQIEGLGECTVLDRMNERYYYAIDWHMGQDIERAKNFGVQTLRVKIIE